MTVQGRNEPVGRLDPSVEEGLRRGPAGRVSDGRDCSGERRRCRRGGPRQVADPDKTRLSWRFPPFDPI